MSKLIPNESTGIYILPGDNSAAKMNGPAGAYDAATGPARSPLPDNGESTLTKNSNPDGDWQAVGNLARQLVHELAARRAALAAEKAKEAAVND